MLWTCLFLKKKLNAASSSVRFPEKGLTTFLASSSYSHVCWLDKGLRSFHAQCLKSSKSQEGCSSAGFVGHSGQPANDN